MYILKTIECTLKINIIKIFFFGIHKPDSA
uniref:Uncharacterized protein n=1 Tax=Arundo donax TaxID=35708 RepID=A0A0A9BUD9_ARUDO